MESDPQSKRKSSQTTTTVPLYEAMTPREMIASGDERADWRNKFAMFTASSFETPWGATLSNAGTGNVTRNTIHRFFAYGSRQVIRIAS
jgi:hypothetical protein